MKWEKRLKWIRISKFVIPIALAISIIFAGFSVFANEAKNFVVDINYDENIKLSLTYNYEDAKNLTNLTDHLEVPVLGSYRDVTWDPSAGKSLKYDEITYAENLPDDIAMHDGVHSVFSRDGVVSFFSFSFYLVNSSPVAVDVDISINIDEVVTGNNEYNYHIDEAVRVMLIEGKSLLSSDECKANSVIYKKPEADLSEDIDEEQELANKAVYSNMGYTIKPFYSNTCVMQNNEVYFPCTLEPVSVMDESNIKRYTVILWLEGWDRECTEAIYRETMKMSMSFKGVG